MNIQDAADGALMVIRRLEPSPTKQRQLINKLLNGAIADREAAIARIAEAEKQIIELEKKIDEFEKQNLLHPTGVTL